MTAWCKRRDITVPQIVARQTGQSGCSPGRGYGELPPSLPTPAPAFNPLGRTTPPDVARQVTPVIPCSPPGDDGYLDVSSDEMSQTFIVLSALPSP